MAHNPSLVFPKPLGPGVFVRTGGAEQVERSGQIKMLDG
jgi:hypothetical protein